MVATGGGLGLIRVTDDGSGMDRGRSRSGGRAARDLEARRTTTLLHSRRSAFAARRCRRSARSRRLTITSRARGAGRGYEIAVDGGRKSDRVKPAAIGAGTRVEVRDLFYATPARLKFMKSERAENAAIADMVKRLALAIPEIGFTLANGDRTTLAARALLAGGVHEHRLARLGRVIGEEFVADALPLDAERDGMRVDRLCRPADAQSSERRRQYLFVNGRPVRDRLLQGAVRAAYGDLVPHGRHPMLALFLTLPPEEVDVNVHPAKTEVRFRDAQPVRALIVAALAGAWPAPDTAPRAEPRPRCRLRMAAAGRGRPSARIRSIAPTPSSRAFGFAERGAGAACAHVAAEAPRRRPKRRRAIARPIRSAPRARSCTRPTSSPRPTTSVVIVDQHAAHERLVYERLKQAFANGGLARQMLLIPEVVELDAETRTVLPRAARSWNGSASWWKRSDRRRVLVREVPALLGKGYIKALVRDLAEELRRRRGRRPARRAP